MTSAISVSNLKKVFNNTEVFHDFSVCIEGNKITTIFGPNGSGKSTLLNILAGIVPIDGGNFVINNFNHFEFSYIFQNYRESLLPWRTNFDNVALPLEIQGTNKEEIKQRVAELQQFFDFNCDWTSYPYELSGGQQQILAFMRALITKPKILFIDEPFSALDYENNLLLRELLQKYWLAYEPTVLLVTHNIEEAVHLADKIIIFSRKPTVVQETIDNPLPYPRTTQDMQTEEFQQIKNKILTVFRQTTNL